MHSRRRLRCATWPTKTLACTLPCSPTFGMPHRKPRPTTPPCCSEPSNARKPLTPNTRAPRVIPSFCYTAPGDGTRKNAHGWGMSESAENSARSTPCCEVVTSQTSRTSWETPPLCVKRGMSSHWTQTPSCNAIRRASLPPRWHTP